MQTLQGDWLLDHTGYHGMGVELKMLALELGIPETEFFQKVSEPYGVEANRAGLRLTLRWRSESGARGCPEDAWSLEMVEFVIATNTVGQSPWTGPWPRGLSPDGLTFERALDVLALDREAYQGPSRYNNHKTTFFISTPHGAALALGLTWAPDQHQLVGLKATYMGKTIPFPAPLPADQVLSAPAEPEAPGEYDWKAQMMRGIRKQEARMDREKR